MDEPDKVNWERACLSVHIRLNTRKNAARSYVWYDVLCEAKTGVIIINFANGRRITGFPEYFSDRPDSPYIYLLDPAWIVMDEDTKEQIYVPLDVKGIMITPEQAMESIEFLNTKTEEEVV